MIRNYLTIDVEDYYQVSAFESFIGHDRWHEYTPRVEQNTRRILNLLAEHNTKDTFFIFGWTAANFPHLVKEIDAAGHQIGCHSYYHRLVYDLTPEEFKRGTRMADATSKSSEKSLRYRAQNIKFLITCDNKFV